MKKKRILKLVPICVLCIALVCTFIFKLSGENQNSAPEENEPVQRPTTIEMTDALFIGDSRTVGLMEYADIKGAEFFSDVGMSVYNIYDQKVSVPGVGKVKLVELLENKKYGKIYVMLGINEVGYKFDRTVSRYNDLLEMIGAKQPEANLFIQANLHVTKARSDKDKVVNNKAINVLNKKLSCLADNKRIFYMDSNVIFDDDEGNLSAEKSEDNSHLYAKYYSEWGKWIIRETAMLVGEVKG